MAYIITSKKTNNFHKHYSHAFGRVVHTEREYTKLMKEGGYVPKAEGDAIAEQVNRKSQKPYVLSEKARAVIDCAKQSSKDGKLKMSPRLIDGMKEVGVSFGRDTSQKSTTEGGVHGD